MATPAPDPDAWCSVESARSGEPMPGTAPRADVWVVVEHHEGWGDAALTRAEHGVRVVMARPLRGFERAPQAWIARAGAGGTLRRGALADPADVAEWDLAEIASGAWDRWGDPVAEPVLLVCANGRRDRCCGHAGGRLARELAEAGRGAQVLTSTHLGGHRFAPTALLLPAGALHGRLDLTSALEVLDQALDGRTPTASLRGHSTLESPAQVAEVAARQRTGDDGLAPLPTRVEITGSRAVATVEVPWLGPTRVELRQQTAEILPSCGKPPEPATRWVLAD